MAHWTRYFENVSGTGKGQLDLALCKGPRGECPRRVVGIYPQANTSGTGVRLTMTEANGQQVVTGLALTQVPDQAIYDGATLKNSQGAFFPLDYVIHDPHDGQLYFTASVTTVVCYGHVHFTDEAYP